MVNRPDKKLKKENEKPSFVTSMAEHVSDVEEISAEQYKKYNVKRGLRNANGTGVVVGLTRVGEVIGYDENEKKEKIPAPGRLYYRGYEIHDLIKPLVKERRFGFEEITYLLLFGELPDSTQLSEFQEILGKCRELPRNFATDVILTNPSRDIMNKIQRAVLTLYSYDDNPDDIAIENVIRQSIELIGHFPTIIAYAYQAQQSFYFNKSLHLHYPEADMSTSENILKMIRPTGEYTELEARVLDVCLILQAEHGGGNNSSFTTHLISSTGTDTYSAISAAVGSLKGPKHGGANIKVVKMLEDIKKNVSDYNDEKQVEDYLAKILRKEANDRSGLIYGMGHAIYTLSDPRAEILKSVATELAKDNDWQESFKLCQLIEKITPALKKEFTGEDKPMCANVDLYSGFVYGALGIPTEIATPLFANARLSGWCAHRLEELTIGNKLMRPAYKSVAAQREYTAIDQR